MIQPVLCLWACVCVGPMFVAPSIALRPEIETETLNEWHQWTFLPSSSARSCPRLHGPPFKAGPLEFWRDNPPLSVMKQPWEQDCVCVHCVCSLSVLVSISYSLPAFSLYSLLTLFSFIFLGIRYMPVSNRLHVFFAALCWSSFWSLVWVSTILQNFLPREWTQMCHIKFLSKLELNN